MLIQKQSMVTGILHTRDIPVNHQKYQKWISLGVKAPHVQDMFPELSPDDREFLLTGITPEEWDNMFPEEE